jgi:hypothetical protein
MAAMKNTKDKADRSKKHYYAKSLGLVRANFEDRSLTSIRSDVLVADIIQPLIPLFYYQQ